MSRRVSFQSADAKDLARNSPTEVTDMNESKNYLNTDEIQADDQLSPKPIEGKDPPRRVRRSEEAIAEGSDDTERVRVPPPIANPD
ncbi:hypothetical protein CUJ84_Chr001597 [Rhizobium leguminosarum]|uniref:Uncharacterized protein n=2 Tax=Rhizobium leguminosarum TaxID=384 RepID=A0A2K9Z152_RHILE|nr:hypothetical protein CUJ84_Chr001597 [Rhizobium leguminosarum]